jgi:hypothetical protein
MYLKYGFGRASTQSSIDVRNGVISREEALKLVREHEGRVPREYLKEFLGFVGMSEEEFFKVMDSFTNKAIFRKGKDGKLKKDVAGNLEKIAYDN